MKKAKSILWGIVLIAVGCLVILSVCQVIRINLLFDGWWTLFILVPCGIGLFTDHDKTGSIIGIGIGVVLLLCAQQVLSYRIIWQLLIPFIVILIGMKLVFRGIFGNKSAAVLKDMKENGTPMKCTTATFSGSNVTFEHEVFEGAELHTVFGGIEYDLRNAIFDKDCAIEATAVFGGIDIMVPADINVKVDSNSVFGGADNKTRKKTVDGAPTLYVKATCIFGGVEIK